MHSFQPSRGRVFFEVLSALAIAASLAGAWAQTGASALLAAAVIAGLSGLVHAFDMVRSRPTVVEGPQRIDFEPETPQIIVEGSQGVGFEPETSQIVVPMVAVEELQVVEIVEQAEAEVPQVEVAQMVESATARPGSARRPGGSRKGSGRRAKAQKTPKVAEPTPVEEAIVPWPTAVEIDHPELSPPTEEYASLADEEAAHPQIAPLFEPDPFVRMPRRAFGRKAG